MVDVPLPSDIPDLPLFTGAVRDGPPVDPGVTPSTPTSAVYLSYVMFRCGSDELPPVPLVGWRGGGQVLPTSFSGVSPETRGDAVLFGGYRVPGYEGELMGDQWCS